MNTWIKKNFNTLLVIFLLLQPILDLITGLGLHIWEVNITFGIIIRILFLLFLVYSVLFIYKKKETYLFYGILLFYGLFYVLGIILFKNGTGFFSEIRGLCRAFYFPALLISLYSIKEEINISKMTLMVILITYLAGILVPNCLNIGFKSYEITKAGTLGFFNSANEISGIISILTPIMVLILVSTKKIIPSLIIIGMYLVVILTIGTKTPLISLGITIFFAYLWFVTKEIKKKSYKKILLSFLVLVVATTGIIIVLPKTNFYKNIKTHLDYLKVDNVVDVFQNKELIDHFIFSQRLTFLENRQIDYYQSNTYQKLFGIGYLNGTETAKAIEMDYFDIYYSHGIIGFIIYFGIYGYFFYLIMKKRKNIDFLMYMIYVSILLSIILSFITGHIITAPAVSILVVIILLMLVKKEKKRLLFTAYSLNLGGIETALINLVNRIDLDKYDVEIILEKKEGIFLDKVKKEITIKEFKVYNNKNKIIRKIRNLSQRIIYTIVNYHTYDFSCCYATYSLSGNKLAKISSTNNSIYIHSNYEHLYTKEKEFREFFDNRDIKKFKHLIFVSEESKASFLKYYKEEEKKCLVLNNFINTKEIEEKKKEKIEEKKPKDKTLFMFIGRLDDTSKKLGRAIHLTKEIKKIELWIIGDGKDKEKYQEMVKKEKLENRIKFLGAKKNPYPYMKLADYILLTSDYEGFPVTYLEAITLHKPIITTIDVSDDKINMGKDYAWIVSKEEKKMVKQVQEILKENKMPKKIDVEKLQSTRMEDFEKLFDGVSI